MRSFERGNGDSRPLTFELDYTKNADGSVLVAMGDTKVLCTAFMEEKVPPFLKNKGTGWITAEYGMLPGSTHSRSAREAARGKQQGRTVEIQRLIGRSLRTCVRLEDLGERSITVDCDVLQADGGTRTASITGGCVALYLCLWKHRKKFFSAPVIGRVAALSVGVHGDEVLVDLDYEEDSSVDVDMNLVMTQDSRFVEIQGTAEQDPFSRDQLLKILDLGGAAIARMHQMQRQVLLDYGVSAEWLP